MSDKTMQDSSARASSGLGGAENEKGNEITVAEDSSSSVSFGDEIVLIPQPSDDPHDPLNWPFRRKVATGLTLTFSLFVGFASALNGQIQITQQVALYHKTPVEISYFNSAASGGLAAACWVWWTVSKKFGRGAVVFWNMLGLMGTQIWACHMRGPGDYNGYMAAKFFAGFFGHTLGILGPLYVVDMFFLHQRGRAFNIMGVALQLGASTGPTLSGFITVHLPWWTEYYWTIAASAFAAVLIFVFVEETTWDRTPGAQNYYARGNWLQRRIQTFFPGTKVVKPPTRRDMIHAFVTPFKIAISPVLLLCAGFDAISFGFWVALNALTPIWLQLPVKAGGYGFSVLDNAAFTTVHWMVVILSQVYGHLVADRIPLWLCARNHGKWKPEFRLHALWIPNFILSPIGLGLVGAGMQYKLHWIVMAVGNFLVTFGANQGIPVTTNYVSECFRETTVEAVVPLNSMRLFLGLTINFYINPWIAAMGKGWTYGLMAFLSAGSFGFMVILMAKGHTLRQASPFHTSSSEEDERVFTKRAQNPAVA